MTARRLASVALSFQLLACRASAAADNAPAFSAEPELAEANFPFVIDCVSFNPKGGQFPPGDAIVVRSVRGDRRHVEPNGRYLIEGDYRLNSAESAFLGPYAPPPHRAPLEVGDIKRVTRGTGHFWFTLSPIRAGPFPVFFSPTSGGEPHGITYVGEIAPPPVENESKPTLLIGIDNDDRISAGNMFVTGEQLDALLTEAKRKNPETSVLIKPYTSVGMDEVKFVMDSCRSAGIEEFGLECVTVVVCDEEGRFSFNHRNISAARLGPLLERAESADINAQVIIEYCEKTPLKELGFATDACRKAGLVNFSLQPLPGALATPAVGGL
jgi:biopolymer transport protein ExbD